MSAENPVNVAVNQFEKCMKCFKDGWGVKTCIIDWSDKTATPNMALFIQHFTRDPKRLKLLYCLRKCGNRRKCFDKFIGLKINEVILEGLDLIISDCNSELHGKTSEFKGFFD